MYRGSADLLQRSARHLGPVIDVIAAADPRLWEIDADNYTDSNFYKGHREAIEEHRGFTLGFGTGESTTRRYTRAKVLDMLFFVKGMKADAAT